MKKHLLVTALMSIWSISNAQVISTLAQTNPNTTTVTTPTQSSTATTQPVSPTPVPVVAPTPQPASIQPNNTNVGPINPFTGNNKASSDIKSTNEYLRSLKIMSNEKLGLQRDEVESLKIELEKKKLIEALNPPPPPPPPPAPKVDPVKVEKLPEVKKNNTTGTSTSVSNKSKLVQKIENFQNNSASNQSVTQAPAPAPTPPQIIAPAPTKFETPELLGVIDISGQKVAMMQFDGQTVQAKVGSMVGGRAVNGINHSGVQWGPQFIQVSTKNGVPSVTVTDNKKGSNSSPSSFTPTSTPTSTSTPVNPPVNTSYNPTYQVNPVGAQRFTGGASGPTGVLQLPPPPPTIRP